MPVVAHGMSTKFWQLALLTLGVWASSTAVIFIRLSHLPAEVLCAWRLLLAALLLSPFAWSAIRCTHLRARRPAIFATLLPGLALAAHLISWTYGARMTNASQATLIVNMTPLAMPFILLFVARERINRGEWFGTVLALCGLLVLLVPRLEMSSGSFFGNFVCFASMLFSAIYLGLGRLSRHDGSIWLYLVLVYFWAGLACLLASLLRHAAQIIPPRTEWLWIFALVLVPTIIGHGLLNKSVRTLGAQTVSVCNLGQSAFASLMAWLLFQERPSMTFYPAAVLIALGAIITAHSLPQQNGKAATQADEAAP